MEDRPTSSWVNPNRSFGVDNRVGRLVEAWAVRFNSISDVVTFGMEAARAITEVSGRIVVCTDYRNLHPLSFGALRTFLVVLKRANPRLERAALVVPRQGVELRDQIEDMVRAAHHPARRLCEDAAEAKAWLCSVLTPEEQLRLEAFFRERQLVHSHQPSWLRSPSPEPPPISVQPK